MRSYSSYIAGLAYEGRANYAQARVRPGDRLRLEPEPDNVHDDGAVALYHHRFKLGYAPARHHWVGQALLEGDRLLADVTSVGAGENGDLRVACKSPWRSTDPASHPKQNGGSPEWHCELS